MSSMDSRTTPAAARVVELETVPQKLRDLLRVAVLLPEKAQDQVADAVQQLLLAFRCDIVLAGLGRP
jgi:hypothetical protein